jgi:hypothetical protein
LEIEPVKRNRHIHIDVSRTRPPIVDICPIAAKYGEPCGRPSTPLAPFAICADHARDLYQHVADYINRVEDSPIFRLSLGWNWVEQERQRDRGHADPDQGFVYYVQIGSHIKIGHTANLGARMRQYPPTRRLLAVETGGRNLEGRRLREFRHLLDAGQEWHLPAPDLIAHINDLRAVAGSDPIPEAAA